MALAEYRLNGHTYQFDTEQVPEGAELVREDITVPPVVLFHDQVDSEEPTTKRGRRAANKQADTPANKSAEDADTED